MTPADRATLTALGVLVGTGATLGDIATRCQIYAALTQQSAAPSGLDPAQMQAARSLKAANDSGNLEGSDASNYASYVATLASQTTRAARISLGDPVETLTPHL